MAVWSPQVRPMEAFMFSLAWSPILFNCVFSKKSVVRKVTTIYGTWSDHERADYRLGYIHPLPSLVSFEEQSIIFLQIHKYYSQIYCSHSFHSFYHRQIILFIKISFSLSKTSETIWLFQTH